MHLHLLERVLTEIGELRKELYTLFDGQWCMLQRIEGSSIVPTTAKPRDGSPPCQGLLELGVSATQSFKDYLKQSAKSRSIPEEVAATAGCEPFPGSAAELVEQMEELVGGGQLSPRHSSSQSSPAGPRRSSGDSFAVQSSSMRSSESSLAVPANLVFRSLPARPVELHRDSEPLTAGDLLQRGGTNRQTSFIGGGHRSVPNVASVPGEVPPSTGPEDSRPALPVGPRVSMSEGAGTVPQVRQAWGQPRRLMRRTPGSNSARPDREAEVNRQVFERAGIRVRTFSRDDSPAIEPAVASVIPEGAAAGNSDASRIAPLADAKEQTPRDMQQPAELRGASKIKRVFYSSAAQIGQRANLALEQHGEQVVADFQMEADEEYQVVGREVLWAEEEEEPQENASRWHRYWGIVKMRWLARAGVRIYSVPMRLGALSPWQPERPGMSQIYSALLCLVVAWAAIHPLVLLSQHEEELPGLYTEAVLGVAAALSLVLFTRFGFSRWDLAATSQRLSCLAQRAGFLNDLARSTWTAASLLYSLFFAAAGLRLTALLSDLEESVDLQKNLVLRFVSFSITSFVLFSQALFLHRLAAALTGAADFFAEQMVLGESITWGREQWTLTMALFSEANNKLHYSLLVLSISLITFVFVAAFEVVISQRPLLELAPGVIVAFAVLMVFSRFATVAAHCGSIPSMLGRLLVDDELHDAQLSRLIARIRDSQAGIHILGVRVSPALLSKGVYSAGGVAMFLVLNFHAELRNLQV